MVTRKSQTKNALSSLPQNLWLPNFKVPRFRVKGSRLAKVVLLTDNKIIRPMKNSDNDSDFYQTWLGRDPQWYVMLQDYVD